MCKGTKPRRIQSDGQNQLWKNKVEEGYQTDFEGQSREQQSLQKICPLLLETTRETHCCNFSVFS